MKRVMAALSLTGLVLGMQQTTVNPPRAAASVPVSMVSEFSCPGSRRCACMSIKPGATIRPAASKTAASVPRVIVPAGAISATRSPSISTSRMASVLDAGSSTRPFLIRSICRFLGSGLWFSFKRRMRTTGRADHQKIKNGHAHGNAVGDLLKHRRLRAVGYLRSDLGAAIDGPGMQNERIFFGQAHALLV